MHGVGSSIMPGLRWTLPCVIALLLPSFAAARSTSLADYVAFAQGELRWTTLAVARGNLGAATGPLVSRGILSAPTSDLVATVVTIAGPANCAGVYANDLHGVTNSCPLVGEGVTLPVVTDDLATVCVPPGGFSCASGAPPTIVPRDTVATLPPGAYGDVIVQGGAGGFGLLRLSGDYQFCSLRVLRHGVVAFDGPSTVTVAGAVTTSTGASIVPTPGNATPAQIVIKALGPVVRFSRGSRIGARVCALSALAKATAANLTGQLLAGRIRLKRSTLTLDATPPSPTTSSTTTTSTSTSSTTTLPSVCGNGVREVGEECDGDDFGGFTCDDASAAGAFLDSASGGFLTCRSDCTIDTSTCVVELCGNCVDDDGNGLTDYEDAACCAGSQRFAQILKKGRIRANKKGGTRLKLKAVLSPDGLADVDPTREDVYLQVRESNGDSLFCARLPAAAFRHKKGGKRIFRFRDKRGIVPGAGGLQRLSIRVDRHGMTRFGAVGKRTALVLPEAGPLEITVAFQAPTTDAPRCSAAVRAFRTGKHAGLRFP